MNDVVNIVTTLINWLSNTEIYGIGLLWWFVIPLLMGLAISIFAKRGKKDEDK